MKNEETKTEVEIRVISEEKNPYSKECNNRHLWSEGYRVAFNDLKESNNNLISLLERAKNLVGHPSTNFSTSVDIACAKWQEDYAFLQEVQNNKKKEEFKQKYFSNNFYWVDKSNYKQLQEIALKVGCLCHTGKNEIINWHEGFTNLGFRTYEKNNNITVFQKEPFLLHTEKATDYSEMINSFRELFLYF